RLPWFLTHQWKSEPMIRFSTALNREVSKLFDRERQADFWAFCTLLQFGAIDDVLAVVEQYPGKIKLLWCALLGCIWTGIKFRVKRFLFRMLHPFSLSPAPPSFTA